MKSYMKYNEEDVFVMGTLHVSNGTSALMIMSKDGTPMARATVNLEDDIDDDIVYIKDYAENKGVYKTLTEGNIVEATGNTYSKYYETHSVMFFEARIIDSDVLKEISEARERIKK